MEFMYAFTNVSAHFAPFIVGCLIGILVCTILIINTNIEKKLENVK